MVEYKLSRLPVNGSIVGFNEFNQIKITMFDMFCLTISLILAQLHHPIEKKS